MSYWEKRPGYVDRFFEKRAEKQEGLSQAIETIKKISASDLASALTTSELVAVSKKISQALEDPVHKEMIKMFPGYF